MNTVSFKPARWLTFSLFVKMILFFLLGYTLFIIRGDYGSLRERLSAVPLLNQLIQERIKIEKRAQAELLNHFLPSFEPLTIYLLKKKQDTVFDTDSLNALISYYEKVVAFLPKVTEAYAVQGFCYYQQNDILRSLQAYQKAIDGNPTLFWPYYNLGVIYFKGRQYGPAISQLLLAIKQKPVETMRHTLTSKLYHQMIGDLNLLNRVGKNHLQESYLNAWKMLILSFHALHHYEEMIQVTQTALQAKVAPQALFQFYAGLGYFEMNRMEEARAYFLESSKLEPTIPEAFEYLRRIDQGKQSRKKTEEVKAPVESQRGVLLPFDTSDIRLEIF